MSAVLQSKWSIPGRQTSAALSWTTSWFDRRKSEIPSWTTFWSEEWLFFSDNILRTTIYKSDKSMQNFTIHLWESVENSWNVDLISWDILITAKHTETNPTYFIWWSGRLELSHQFYRLSFPWKHWVVLLSKHCKLQHSNIKMLNKIRYKKYSRLYNVSVCTPFYFYKFDG